ncbi:MAG: ATP-binding protein [Candidatus Ornithospirochaeta sp.]
MSEKHDGLLIEGLARSIEKNKLACGMDELAAWAVSNNVDEKGLRDVTTLFDSIYLASYERKRGMFSDVSGIPQDERCTFDNYDHRDAPKANIEAVMALKTLSFLKNGYNVVICGKRGTGKTHIAQAIGNECVDHLIKTSYCTMSALKAKIARALKNGSAGSLVSSLSGVQCLIIDDIDKASLTKEETAVLFDVVNRKYSVRGSGSLVITSNKQPSSWGNILQDADLAECILDRLFDRSYCFDFTGESYRGKNKIVTHVDFGTTPKLPKIRN